MKFFQNNGYLSIKKNPIHKITFKNKLYVVSKPNNNPLVQFSKFLFKDGFFTKGKYTLTGVLKNVNFFLYNNANYITTNHPSVKWIVDDFLDKRLSCVYMFDIITNLIKPPFVVKSVSIPKKLRKKTKQKYLIKIVYKNESKRLKSSYKQLYYYNNKFSDNGFKLRLYKSLLFTFLDWKQSYLFKLKSMVFKKFFKV